MGCGAQSPPRSSYLYVSWELILNPRITPELTPESWRCWWVASERASARGLTHGNNIATENCHRIELPSIKLPYQHYHQNSGVILGVILGIKNNSQPTYRRGVPINPNIKSLTADRPPGCNWWYCLGELSR